MYQKPRTRAKSYDNTPIQRIDQGVVSRWQDKDASFYAAAGLLKSTNSIRRNSRMKKDIAVLEDRLTTGSVSGILWFPGEETEEDITELEERMTEVVQLCSQQSKVTAMNLEVEEEDGHQKQREE